MATIKGQFILFFLIFFSPRGWQNHPQGPRGGLGHPRSAGLGWPKPPLALNRGGRPPPVVASHPFLLILLFYYFYFDFLKNINNNLLFVDCFRLLDKNKRSRSNIEKSGRQVRDMGERNRIFKDKKRCHVIQEGFSGKPAGHQALSFLERSSISHNLIG